MSSNEPKNTTSVFLQLFEKRNRFERFAALYIHDAETVRDIVMDSYHYMWERRESLDMGGMSKPICTAWSRTGASTTCSA